MPNIGQIVEIESTPDESGPRGDDRGGGALVTIDPGSQWVVPAFDKNAPPNSPAKSSDTCARVDGGEDERASNMIAK